MTGSRLLIGVASVLAGTTVLLGVFGLVYNPIILVAAAPFAVATYFLWSHATGRLEARMHERARRQRVDAGPAPGPGPDPGPGRREPGGGRAGDPGREGGAGQSWRPGDETPAPSHLDAARVLGVDPDADDAAIRRAFRQKAKELHPDAPDGDEAAFRRARAAYERLTDSR